MEGTSKLNAWLQGLYDKAGYLTPEMVRDDARDEDSPGHAAIFSMSIDDAAEAFYLDRAHRTIANAKKYVVGSDGNTYHERSFYAIPSGEKGTSYTYYSYEDVQTDTEKLTLAIKEANKRLRDAERAMEWLIKVSNGKHTRKTSVALSRIRTAQQAMSTLA